MGESHTLMGDIERVRRNNRIDQLSTEERVQIAHDIAIKYHEGWTYADLSRHHNLTRDAVKTLIQEHAAYVRNAMPETRSLILEEYRRFYGEMKNIDPRDPNVPVLVKAKAIEARIQILTRQDKLLGHEIQGDMDGAVNTVAEMVRAMNQRGDLDGVSATDLANLEEEDIVDAEVIEDDRE